MFECSCHLQNVDDSETAPLAYCILYDMAACCGSNYEKNQIKKTRKDNTKLASSLHALRETRH